LFNTPRANADASVTRVFDVTNLLTQSERAPKYAPTAPKVKAIQLPPPTDTVYEMTLSELIDLIRHKITPDDWDHGARITRFRDRQIVVYAPLQTQQQIVAFLGSLRSEIITINLTTRLVSLNAKRPAGGRISIPQTQPSQNDGSKTVFLTHDQLNKIIKDSASITHAPRVTVSNGKGAEVYQITYRPFVVGFDVQTINGKEIAAPKMADAEDGIAIGLKARTSIGDPTILVVLSVRVMSFNGFKPATDPQHPNLHYMIPQTDDHQIDAIVSVPQGMSALIPLSKDEVAIVTPEIIDPRATPASSIKITSTRPQS
jgi:hypothetical protein